MSAQQRVWRDARPVAYRTVELPREYDAEWRRDERTQSAVDAESAARDPAPVRRATPELASRRLYRTFAFASLAPDRQVQSSTRACDDRAGARCHPAGIDSQAQRADDSSIIVTASQALQ
jgi:hypothetical protein